MTGIRLTAAALLFAPLLAYSAGLGRLNVLSALGQPLDAEIEIVSLQPGEEDSLSARLASPEAFRQAGMELSPALLGVQFSIEKRAGRPYLRLRTAQTINEPFLDMLVELQWATGRLVREYTFLLDPPEYKGPAPIPAAPAPAPAPRAEAAPAPAPAAPRIEARPIAPTPAPAPAKAAATHEVKKGDTLGAIARRNKPDGVTFNQMLIALYRANESAFIRGNINLVRAGRILAIPDKDEVSAVDPAEANRLVRSHMEQFAEYRRALAARVAAAPAREAPPAREAAGRITPKPEAAPAEPKDQLRLSRADPAKPGAAPSRAAAEDDRAARERAAKEAQSRIADLEKNVSDLQKLLAIKSQQLAELEKKAGEKPAAAPVVKPEPPKPVAEPAKPAPAPAKAVAEAPKAPEPAKAPEPPKAPEPAKAPEAPKAVEPAKAPTKPVAEAKKPKPAPAKAPEPDMIDEVVSFVTDPVSGLGLAGVLVLLAGYGAWAWRRKKATQTRFQDSVLGAATGGTAASVFGAAAQPAPAAAGAAAAPSPAQAPAAAAAAAGAAAPEAEELDPIAEADVYMAYGRGAQAEEILKEALAKDPDRLAVHAKLLEIYAAKRDTKAFEQTALKMKSLTGASGPEWDKAMALGHSIDSGNPLYGAGAAAAAEAPAPAAAAPSIDFDIGGAAPAPAAAETASAADKTGPIDFDLGGGAAAEPAAAGEAKADTTAALDFDLGGGAPAEKTDFAPGGTLVLDSGEAKAASGGLDFDLDKTLVGGLKLEAPEAKPAAKDPDATVAMDFDLNLDLGGAKPEAKPAAEAPAMDLGSISLDLGEPGAPAAAAGGDAKWREMAEKLELSKAFLDIGQKDDARELLKEVMKDGDAAQQAQAKQMLAGLG